MVADYTSYSGRSHQTFTVHARLAQLIERFLAKEEATGLSPVSRTKLILENDLHKRRANQRFFALTQTRTLTNFFGMM
jgi:hypothetical protein